MRPLPGGKMVEGHVGRNEESPGDGVLGLKGPHGKKKSKRDNGRGGEEENTEILVI